MKKALILSLTGILLYSFLRELTIPRLFLLCIGLGCSYAIYAMPPQYITGAKYPLIGLSLAASACFLFFPHIPVEFHLQGVVIFVSFYGVTLYLATLESHEKGFAREVTGLTLLFISSAINLILAGKSLFLLPLSLTVILFLFIIDRIRIVPFIVVYAASALFFLYRRGVTIFGTAPGFSELERYVLLGICGLFFAISFISLVKNTDALKTMAFFGFLFVSIDLLMVLGFRLSSGLAYQPFMALFIMVPLIGAMLKASEGRA
jgi:hypothetical protein